MPDRDRTAVATAALGAVLAGLVAYAHPVLIPALTIAFAAWVALYAYLKL
ncbi:hypothetical protein [Streptomyces lunaelactis]|nr:hypothetical protein [Streptomyces lunaelactis]NUK85931.1 hypothetical protein [Streptomyces lunaelactis]